MSTVIERIQAYDIPVDSYIHAVAYMMDDPGKYSDMPYEEVLATIVNIAGLDGLAIEDERLARYTLLYLVQESVRVHLQGTVPDGSEMFNVAMDKAVNFIRNNPWVFAQPEVEEKVDAVTGKPKMKKGKKQEMAIELYKKHVAEGRDKIIEVFQQEMDMSKAGARTYYYNMRKKFGDD
jgi:hypothetical protein